MAVRRKNTNNDLVASQSSLGTVASSEAPSSTLPSEPTSNSFDVIAYESTELPIEGDFAIKLFEIQVAFHKWIQKNKKAILITVLVILGILYCVYLGFAIKRSLHDSIPLIVVPCLLILAIVAKLAHEKYGDRLSNANTCTEQTRRRLKWIFGILFAIAMIVFVCVDARKDPKRLMSAIGLVVFILIAFICSRNPAKVSWHPVFAGLFLQFLLGLFVLRWTDGFKAVQWLGEQVTSFLSHTNAGTTFVFGELGVLHEFAMVVLPAIIFFGAVTELLYHFGVIQIIIRYYGRLMEFVMKISPVECFVSAANVFLGPNTAVLTIASFVPLMTMSELHLVLTTGFSTVDAGLFGVYTSFGIKANHLISASVMSAPAALAIGKMFYPETGKSQIATTKTLTFQKRDYKNAFDAYMAGAWEGAKVLAHVVFNLLAFVAMLNFFNATINWFGHRVGVTELSFEFITSYLFVPLAWLMGVESADCRQVARLIGTKVFLTDIYGYLELGALISNREQGLLPAISERSEVIATYALCGFASFPDISICLGAIGAIVPSRKSDLAQVALRSMIAGNLACFLTASIAGLLFSG